MAIFHATWRVLASEDCIRFFADSLRDVVFETLAFVSQVDFVVPGLRQKRGQGHL